MKARVVQDDANSPGFTKRQQLLADVRLVQVVGKDIDAERIITYHLVQKVQDKLARCKAEPFVLLLKGELFAHRIGTGDLRSVEQELMAFWPDTGVPAKVTDKSLRLDEAAREPDG